MTTHGPDSSVETIGAALPAHENAPDDPPNPWADAAQEFLTRAADAKRRIDSILGRLPAPGCTDEEDMLALEMFTDGLEVVAGDGERLLRFRDERRQAANLARKLERAADVIGKS